MANRAKTVTAPAAKRAAPKKAPAKAAAAPPRKAPAAKAAAPPSPPPGWYRDTTDPTQVQYWDGAGWLGAAIPEHLLPDGALLSGPDLPPSADVAPAPEAEGGTTTLRGTVVWFGRTLAVQFPDEGQIVVWRRVAKQFDGLTREQLIAMGDDRVGRMLDRGVSVIFSVLVDDADKDWVEDGLLEQRWTLAEAAQIIPLALAALNQKAQAAQDRLATAIDGGPNRAARRNTTRKQAPAAAAR